MPKGGRFIGNLGEWKSVSLNVPFADQLKSDGLIGLEELTSYTTSKTSQANSAGDEYIESNEVAPEGVEGSLKKKRKKGKKKNPQENGDLRKRIENTSVNMDAWKDFFLPQPILQALEAQGFTEPTAIQAQCLTPAMKQRKDILGAAETGSGKTLAFGIPLLSSIYHMNESIKASEGSNTQIEDEESGNESPNLQNSASTQRTSSAAASNNDVTHTLDLAAIQTKMANELGNASSEEFDLPPSDEEEVSVAPITPQLPKRSVRKGPVMGLVLTPTRELAVQVCNHLKNCAKFTGIQVVSVIGGMSAQKQERLLKRKPEVIVATPGRLWEMMQQDDHLKTLHKARFLVIDEADRMIEKGHFQELSNILKEMGKSEEMRRRRQTFVFSATLLMVHSAPKRAVKRKRKKQFKDLSQQDKLASLVNELGLRANPMVVDLTRKRGTAETLTETRIVCATPEQKDQYLYYLLMVHPGRTLVFANSKDCVRRLQGVLSTLKLEPLVLHADMHQKQRLKSIERFASSRGLLLATDVAARGLDIPRVQHVVHYQAPRTSENYIHRSGRTARALHDGLSVMLVGPDDTYNYRKILSALNRDEDLATFPVDEQLVKSASERVRLARELDKEENKKRRLKSQNDWFLKAARDVDVELDENHCLHELGDDVKQSNERRKLKSARRTLDSLLSKPLLPAGFSYKYPTQTGRLLTPTNPASTEDVARRSGADERLLMQLKRKRAEKLKSSDGDVDDNEGDSDESEEPVSPKQPKKRRRKSKAKQLLQEDLSKSKVTDLEVDSVHSPVSKKKKRVKNKFKQN